MAKGYGDPFTIYRKRNSYAFDFLAYLDAKLSAAQEWPDRSDNGIDPVNGDTGGEETSDAQPLHIGYRFNGTDIMTGNLGLLADVEAFTIACVITRDENSNNDSVYYSLFGSSHYPRLYFVGTTLHAQIELDGAVKEVTVADVDDYITPGKPAFIVFRGSADTGIEVLIDNVSRGTQTDTGTDFDTGVSDFALGDDANLSYELTGELRMLSVLDAKMTDAELAAFLSMLEYEGTMDVWFDKYSKWSTGGSLKTSTISHLGNSPYVGTAIEIEA